MYESEKDQINKPLQSDEVHPITGEWYSQREYNSGRCPPFSAVVAPPFCQCGSLVYPHSLLFLLSVFRVELASPRHPPWQMREEGAK